MNTFKRTIALIGLLLSSINYGYAVEAGDAAPQFNAKLFSGLQVNNASYSKKVILINFWASWCDPCRQELPALEQYQREHIKDAFKIITVSMDDKADLSKAIKIMKDYGFDSTWIGQSDFRQFDRIWRIPLSYLIDKNGQIIKADWYQDNDGLTQQLLEKTINPLLSE